MAVAFYYWREIMYYFDNSATTQATQEILSVIQEVNKSYFANPSSAHRLGEESRALMNSARKQIADILSFRPEEIFFASSGTEVNNWVLQSILKSIKAHHPNRNKVLISAIEHPSIINQIPLLEEYGYQVEMIPVEYNGRINLARFEELLDDQVLLVSIMAVNNEVGTVQSVQEISGILNKYPQVVWHVDGVQAVTSQLDLLKQSRIDMISLSGHKFHAGRGTGVLAKRERVSALALLYGGGQEMGLRSSTENLSSIVATSKALRLAMEKQLESKQKLKSFRNKIMKKFKQEKWQTFSDDSSSEHIICAALSPIPGEVLLHAFEEHDIFVSTTSACSSRNHTAHATLRAMGVDDKISASAIRISMSTYTTEEEVNYLLEIISKITLKFKK